MKIALIGYGKMGTEMERMAIKKKHEISAIIDSEEDWEKSRDALASADVAIEFSTPETAQANILRCFDLNIPVVSGTTGWQKELENVRKICLERNQALFFSTNFSIGVNVFFEVNKLLAQLMSKYPEYEISIEEIHHIQKLDTPSGTAIKLADDIIQNIGRKEKWVKAATGNPEEVPVKSVRTEDVTGTHSVSYESAVDIIEIRHTAKNRMGFVLGALSAAEWIIGRKGFFGMKDML
ncbi:MAG: 4-hydroxy-tetrahydrodipicolinate reductase [Bacteroidetes bacterium]|nr:4-hydroxy-tetrahydrodipicolinate reductase [Bacteroidota bacterium]